MYSDTPLQINNRLILNIVILGSQQTVQRYLAYTKFCPSPNLWYHAVPILLPNITAELLILLQCFPTSGKGTAGST